MSDRPVVVVTNRVHQDTLDLLAERCRVVPSQRPEPLNPGELRSRARNADALMVFMPDRIDAALLAECPRLKIVAGALKGADNFDIDACSRHGVWFTVVDDLLSAPTAELAVALVLGLLRRVREGDERVRSGAFRGWRPDLYGRSLQDATVGVIGMGAVARELHPRLRAFGARVVATDPAIRGDDLSVEALLRSSDVIMPLLPLTETTRHLIDAHALALVRPDAVIVNVGRGSVVDEAAIADALEADRLGGYAADVFAMEDWARPDRPRAIDERLRRHPRTLFTPHLGSAVGDTRRRIELDAAHSILEALDGRRPRGALTEVGAIATTT
jgi:phosphonate dehydrogenase